MPFLNRVRLPIMFTKPQFPVERNTFRLADGSSKVLYMVIRNTYEGKTDQLPKEWHQKLVVALGHDTVSVENERLLSNVVLDGDYGIDWQDFLQYPIAGASFNVQVTPFNATNTNCQTCEEMSQVVAVDDYTDDVWAEGTTNEFPDNLTANDSICCAPFTVSLVTFNTLYFSAASVTPDGILSATVNTPSPNVSDVLIATYRVTCESGGYDEANVYGNVSGSSTCEPASGLDVVIDPLDDTTAQIIWDGTSAQPTCGFDWELYLLSDPVTPMQSGNTALRILNLTGLTPNETYVFIVTANCCDGDLSIPSQIQFTQPQNFGASCGTFTVTYLPYADSVPQSISYMDCAGEIQNLPLTYAQETDICMLITPGTETPVYFVASSSDITINYDSLC